MKIKTFKDIINESKSYKYEFGCIMLKLDVKNWKNDVLSMIDKEDIYDVDGYGLEKETHITLFFGILGDVDYKDVVEKLKNVIPPGYIELKNISIFEQDDYDVVKFDINDDKYILTDIHNYIGDNFPNKKTFEYHPHCTIGYVKKGRGVKYIQELENPVVVKPSKIYYTYPKDNGNNKGKIDIIEF